MKKIVFILYLLFLGISYSYGTHNRAGEITYTSISQLKYEAIIITYTRTGDSIVADRPQLEIEWGDGSNSKLDRNSEIMMEDDVKKNTYVGTHAYPGPGTYTMSVLDPNRNKGIVNIPNSVNTPFYIESTVKIHAFLGVNNSAQLLNPPLDHAVKDQLFIHNTGAYDVDGDSLSYKLISCKGLSGKDIYGYTYPSTHPVSAKNSISINPVTGDLIWDSPQILGEYNVAILIEEWRHGILVGTIIRDMQIFVEESTNIAPVIDPIPDLCVEAGSIAELMISASDVNGPIITMSGSGGPFVIDNPAIFPEATGASTVFSKFSWQTTCDHVRKQAYYVTVRAEDNGYPALVDLETFQILVLGPSPKNPTAAPFGSQINVGWEISSCLNAVGYNIYRRIDLANFVPDSCQTGLPSSTGYSLINTVNGLGNSAYIDKDPTLIHGEQYCYIITAIYSDGAESYASTEVCTELKRDVPIITHVTVDATDKTAGQISVKWSMPIELSQFSGPFEYMIYRSSGGGYQLIDSTSLLKDTIYIDADLNTVDKKYSYKIEFFNDSVGKRYHIGTTQKASSIFLSSTVWDNVNDLKWSESVPWTNNSYVIYRKNPATLLFDSIGTSDSPSFWDAGLVNGKEYCYQIKSIGAYSSLNLVNPIINLSQEICSTPIDVEAPCAPTMVVQKNDCVNMDIELNWNNPNGGCADDVIGYKFYFAKDLSKELELTETYNSPNDTTYSFSHYLSIAGCYAVSAVDSFLNESALSTLVCTDNCPNYFLPNVFTPDNNNLNDFFTPFGYRSVASIDMRIYNRWGALMYSTTNMDILWDGKNQDNNRECSEGTYFYICKVTTYRDIGEVEEYLKGYVQLLRVTDNQLKN